MIPTIKNDFQIFLKCCFDTLTNLIINAITDRLYVTI